MLSHIVEKKTGGMEGIRERNVREGLDIEHGSFPQWKISSVTLSNRLVKER